MNFRQVHLDFHTSEKIAGIGSHFHKKEFQKALKIGHVNSITLFSKCHHGWAYHPSATNKTHPHLHFDLLAAQIEAAHEIGVKTPVYLSAGLDEKMAVKHPEWLVRDKNNQTTWLTLQRLKHVGFLCTFTSNDTRKHRRLMSFHKTFTTKDTFVSISGSIRLVSKPKIFIK